VSETVPGPGALLDFREGEGVLSGVVLREEKGKIVVVTPAGATERITASRIAQIAAESGRGPSDPAEGAKRAEAHARLAEALARDVELEPLWELLLPEGGGRSLGDMARIALGRDDGTARGAVLRALLAERLWFQRKDDLWAPRTREAVESMRLQRAREEARAGARLRFVDRARQALRGSGGPAEPPADADEKALLDSVIALAVHGGAVPAAKGAQRLVSEIGATGITPEEAAFSLVRALGVFERDENLLILRHEISTGFPQAVIEAAESLASGTAAPSVGESRVDLTGLDIFTIDDSATLDLDDALSVEPQADGALRVGVHIADPAAVIAMGSAVDLDAAARGTSHYLPERRIPMLPPVLSEDICSLKPGEIRRALSVFCTVTADGTLMDTELVLSLVRSRRRWTYAEADEVLARTAGGPAHDPLALLARAAVALERARLAAGATPIAAPEVEVAPGENGELRLVRVDQERPARRLVAEMMVLAGRTVAERAIAERVPVLFRRQASPDEPVVPPPLVPYDPVAVRKARRAMRRSDVSPLPGPHAALGLAAYAQATSPLRRYQDLVTHRQLRALVAGAPPPYSVEDLQRIAAAYEERERASRLAERGSRDYWLLKWIEAGVAAAAPGRCVVDGIVTSAEARRTDVELSETLLAANVAARPGHAPGQALRLEVERVSARAGVLNLREEP